MADYAELDDYPQEKFGENGQFYAERKVKCAWGERYDVIYEFGANGGQLYPYKPGTGARAVGAGIAPHGAMTGIASSEASYEHAIITVVYSTATAVKISDNWITEEIQPSGGLIHLNSNELKWGDGVGLEPAEAPQLILPSFDYVITYHHLFSVPVQAYRYMGYSNLFMMITSVLNLRFAPESLLYVRPWVRRSFDPGLLNTFQLQYRFSYKYTGWNKFYNVKNGAWEAITNNAGQERKPYPPIDFSPLVP